jgi:hypothetical protein
VKHIGSLVFTLMQAYLHYFALQSPWVPKGLSEIQLLYYLLQVKDDNLNKKSLKALANFFCSIHTHWGIMGTKWKKRAPDCIL